MNYVYTVTDDCDCYEIASFLADAWSVKPTSPATTPQTVDSWRCALYASALSAFASALDAGVVTREAL